MPILIFSGLHSRFLISSYSFFITGSACFSGQCCINFFSSSAAAAARMKCNPVVVLIVGSKGIIIETDGKFSGMPGYRVFISFGFGKQLKVLLVPGLLYNVIRGQFNMLNPLQKIRQSLCYVIARPTNTFKSCRSFLCYVNPRVTSLRGALPNIKVV